MAEHGSQREIRATIAGWGSDPGGSDRVGVYLSGCRRPGGQRRSDPRVRQPDDRGGPDRARHGPMPGERISRLVGSGRESRPHADSRLRLETDGRVAHRVHSRALSQLRIPDRLASWPGWRDGGNRRNRSDGAAGPDGSNRARGRRNRGRAGTAGTARTGWTCWTCWSCWSCRNSRRDRPRRTAGPNGRLRCDRCYRGDRRDRRNGCDRCDGCDR